MHVELATDRHDAAAADAVRAHHAQMAGALALLVGTLERAAAAADPEAAEDARGALTHWCRTELVPHALAEEGSMYPAAQALPEARLLIEAMLGEHTTIVGLVEEVAETADPVRAAGAARALQVLFESHLAKENDLVLPLLTATPEVSVAALLGGMHELLGSRSEEVDHVEPGPRQHTCGCGEADAEGYPELDARAVPHAIRHATIFGALDAVAPEGGLVLVAPHDPLPLLAQVAERYSGDFDVRYLERGPEAWRLSFHRVGTA